MVGCTSRESQLFSHGSWDTIIHSREKEESLIHKLWGTTHYPALCWVRSDAFHSPLDLKTLGYKNLWNSGAPCPQIIITLSLEMRGQSVQWEQLLHLPHPTTEHLNAAFTFPPLFTLHSSLKAPHRDYLFLTFPHESFKTTGGCHHVVFFGVLKHGSQQIRIKHYRQDKF